VPRFIRGELDYYLGLARFATAMRVYREIEGRPVIEQVLNLDTMQRNRLFDFLRTNALPENAYYRYDFLFDNCSTRIRDALESVFGDGVRFPDSLDGPVTFRQLLDPYLRDRSSLRLGIEVLLGARVDRPATAREQTFLPDYLSTVFDAAVLVDDADRTLPLVVSRDTIMWVAGYERPAGASHRAGIALWIVCGIVMLMTLREARRGQISERVDTILYGIVGLVGCFLVFMWSGTAHHVTADNWNLLWAWPTHLLFAGALARRGLSRWKIVYTATTGAAMIILAALWQLVPQDLPEPALAVTVMLALRGTWAAVYGRLKRADELQPAGPGA
ncbi:MAG: DUF4105 domain-containing protein, partial [Rhodothermales bacterium]|nr:DUF4105 domain-containing protein [Rhodothermales bacterium]